MTFAKISTGSIRYLPIKNSGSAARALCPEMARDFCFRGDFTKMRAGQRTRIWVTVIFKQDSGSEELIVQFYIGDLLDAESHRLIFTVKSNDYDFVRREVELQ